ncbi:MAG TPA: glycoside hydrolase family 13 protein [Clostridia bacterium]|nr:glycoside hydrolase family 13 protein [Clostridia bacterium]
MQRAFGTLQRYNDTLLYNPLFSVYKTPFGAVPTCRRVDIVFPVKCDVRAEKVFIIIRNNSSFFLRLELERVNTINDYDYFECHFALEDAGTYFYRFEITRDFHTLFVGKDTNNQAIIRDWMPEWQLTVYDAEYKTPETIKGGIVYHIFVDRFCRVGAMPAPRFGVKKKWHEEVTIKDPDGVYRANDFYGGNFKGIKSKLDYLKDLGVTCMYLSPIFESSSNHRYDTGDYTKIDHLLGSEEDFKDLIESAKEKGIIIILDGVFNHTGADSIYFNKFGHYDSIGAYKTPQSPYYDWYTFIEFPEKYVCWWGITVVPTVSRTAKGYHEFIAGKNGIIDKWQSMGVKGWRLDVVDELSSEFVEQIYSRVKENDPDAVVIGEVWEDASTKYSYGEERKYFRGKELDGVMNYVFKDAILEYILKNDATTFINKIMAIVENYPKPSLDVSLTLVDSHDTFRAINALAEIDVSNLNKEDRLRFHLFKYQYNKGKARLKVASAIQYFLPGVPSLYYGDEVGMEGFEDPINRRPFPWDNIDYELLAHYRFLGSLRKEYRDKFLGGIEITTLDNMICIDRDGLMLIVNVGERKALDKPYYDIYTNKTVSVLDTNHFLITHKEKNQ